MNLLLCESLYMKIYEILLTEIENGK